MITIQMGGNVASGLGFVAISILEEKYCAFNDTSTAQYV
jgi:hypothetical protein